MINWKKKSRLRREYIVASFGVKTQMYIWDSGSVSGNISNAHSSSFRENMRVAVPHEGERNYFSL